MNIKKIKLTKSERAIERALLRGEYRPMPQEEVDRIAAALDRYKKDAVLNIRVNSGDIASIKKKAKALGVRYQSFISELIHRYAA